MLNSQRPALNSLIFHMEYLRRNEHLAETAFYMYLTRLNYITFMFYQIKMIVALKTSALEPDSIHSHIYFHTLYDIKKYK